MSLSRVFRSQPGALRRPVRLHTPAAETGEPVRLPDPQEIVARARKEAEAILEEAAREAESIVSRAQEEAGRIATEARETGRNDGYLDGHAKGLAEAQGLLEERRPPSSRPERLTADATNRNLALALVIEIS